MTDYIAKEIIKNILTLNRHDCNAILQYLHGKNIKISECADGCRINLSSMEMEALTELKQLIDSFILIQSLTRITI